MAQNNRHKATGNNRELPPKNPKKRLLRRAREQTLFEWLGPRVLDPNRNICEASSQLDSILKGMGVTSGVEEEKLRQVWTSVAGDFVSKNATPASLKRGILTVSVLQPSVRFDLEMMKGKLLRNLKDELGAGVVKQIRFQIG